MERSPGLEVPDTTSLREEPTSLPGADLRCGSRTFRSRSPSSSDPLVLMRDTPVCRVVKEPLTNGVNLSRATQGTSSKDTATTMQHTIKANTRNSTPLLPLTNALDKTTMLTSNQFSFLTFPSNYNSLGRSNAHFFPDRPPPLPCSFDQPTIFSLMFSGPSTVSSLVSLFGGLLTVYGWYNLPLFCIVADPSTAHERTLS